MKSLRMLFAALMATFLFSSCNKTEQIKNDVELKGMMVRIAEIEVDSSYLQEYNAILKEESEASVRLEPGVISIYPMYQRDNPTQIRLLEIYANKAAYEAHLKTPHFQKYKTTTLKMVKALRLIDMEALDPETMPQVFSKLKK